MSRQTAVRLPDDIYQRLDDLATRTGRNKTYYIREALKAHLDDMEDIYLAEQVLKRLCNGDERTSTLDEVERELGLAD